MSIRMSSVLTAVFLSMSLCSCIKEKREFCPCFLSVDFSGIDKGKSDSLHLGVFLPDDILCVEKLCNDSYGNRFSLEVPKGAVRLSVFSFSPVKDAFSWNLYEDGQGTSMRIPYGCECPPVYTHFAQIDTRKESHTEYVSPLKNFCSLSVLFRTDFPSLYRISVQGNVCGYGNDGTLVDGDFIFSTVTDDEGRFSVRIPRQKDGSLCLLIDDNGGIVRKFPLGDYLLQSGYDWSEPSLRDADVVIDYATAEIAIFVNEWEYVFNAEVLI